jgi:hypothetical protein
MDPFADTSDLVDYWRPLTPAEDITAEKLLIVASAMIRSTLTTVDARIASGDLDPALVEYAVCQMVIEKMSRPPGGVKSISQTAIGYTQTVAYDSANGLILTAELLAPLLPIIASTGGARSVRLKNPCPPPDPYCYR